jgi:tRNA-specific 2-thiouridylase
LTKDEVRQIAAEMGLPAPDRPESREICFIPDNDHAGFVARYTDAAARPGPIIDGEGRTLGRHRGLAAYTVGQRKGLGIAAPAPLYVTDIRPDDNAVVVGTREATRGTALPRRPQLAPPGGAGSPAQPPRQKHVPSIRRGGQQSRLWTT